MQPKIILSQQEALNLDYSFPDNGSTMAESKMPPIVEVFPDGMTEAEFMETLRANARQLARLFLETWPNIIGG